MRFDPPLIPATFLRRYKRFFADVALEDGTEITVHCPNPGSMMGLDAPGARAWVSVSANPKRKLAHTLEVVETGDALVGVNTMAANRLAAEALAAGAIAELSGYDSARREVRYGAASRVDFLLEHPDRPPCFVEVKSVTLSRTSGLAEFPDCVSARALRHLADLTAEVKAGGRAVLLFAVQRDDCEGFDAAHDLDPAYSAGLIAAAQAGVEVVCYGAEISPRGILLARPIPWNGATLAALKSNHVS
jgi:sugar fermentation stimulation protein A